MTTINNEDPSDPSVHEQRELPKPAAWRERAARVSQATAQRVPARSETGPFAYTGAQLLASQPAGVAVDRGVRPSVWWREQRGAFEGPQTLAPMYLLGPEKPGSYDHGATYEPLYDQAALAAAVAAERERSHELLQAADHIRAGLEAAKEKK